MVSYSLDPRDDLIATICKSKCVINSNLREIHNTCRSDKISVCSNLTIINVNLVRVITVYMFNVQRLAMLHTAGLNIVGTRRTVHDVANGS